MMAAAVLSAGATMIGAVSQSNAMKAQARTDQQRAEIESQWAERRALEERAAGQRAGGEEMRKAHLAQGRLTTLAAASGGTATDPGVLDTLGDIEQEGQYNARTAEAGHQQKAAGIQYQSNLDRWTTDANARIKQSSARSTLIGGIMGAAGQVASGYAKTPMGSRYGTDPSPSYRYG
jgi:type II secretory pathway pseudopilin PulG